MGVSAPAQKRIFSLSESVFAWLCLIFSFILLIRIPVGDNPVGALAFYLVLLISSAAALMVRKIKLGAFPAFIFASGLIISFSLLFSSNAFIWTVTFFFVISAYIYYVYAAAGNTLDRSFSDYMASDFLRAAFVMPFISIVSVYPALGGSGRSKGKAGSRFILKLLLGIAIALVPTIIVIALLSYDESFVELGRKIIRFDLDEIPNTILRLSLSIPLAMYLFGLFESSILNKGKERQSVERYNRLKAKRQIMSPITVIFAVLPILAVYVVFFISQWQYYTAAFKGVLPENINYADYAREGFFQLCAVSAINFVMIFLAALFIKRKTERSPIVLKILSIVITLFTYVLMSTAMAKLIMYIDIYGLTRKRVYAAWFMILLALLFIVLVIKQFVFRFKALPVSVIVFVVMFAALSLGGTDSFIAKYNVDRYLDGDTESIDIDALADLGDSGVPQLVRLAEYFDEKNGTDISDYNAALEYATDTKNESWSAYSSLLHAIYDAAADYDDSFWAFNIPHHLAGRAFDSVGIKKGEYPEKRTENERADAYNEPDESSYMYVREKCLDVYNSYDVELNKTFDELMMSHEHLNYPLPNVYIAVYYEGGRWECVEYRMEDEGELSWGLVIAPGADRQYSYAYNAMYDTSAFWEQTLNGHSRIKVAVDKETGCVYVTERLDDNCYIYYFDRTGKNHGLDI